MDDADVLRRFLNEIRQEVAWLDGRGRRASRGGCTDNHDRSDHDQPHPRAPVDSLQSVVAHVSERIGLATCDERAPPGWCGRSTCSGILPTMAFVVARRDGRFEIRESLATPDGPRARTLATFRALTDAVLDQAEDRATRPFDRRRVEARAVAAGAQRDSRQTARLAHHLLEDLYSGRSLPPGLAAALARQLGGAATSLPDSLPAMADWFGSTARERGEALRDLLRLTDRLPPGRPRRGKRFPRIVSASV